MTYLRWTPILLLLATIAAPLGCARWIEMRPSAADRQEAAFPIVAQARVPFHLEMFHVTLNGAAQDPSAALERRILNQIRDTKLFSVLIPLEGTASAPGEKIVTATVAFDQTVDSHGSEAAWKGFVIGASMFLLSPVIELKYDYGVQASLELERWDGHVTRYLSRSHGTARYNLFGASPLVIEELKGHVTETCLTDLMAQLVRDAHLYLAGSAPLPGSSIKTVVVKARRPMPGAVSALPVSLEPTH